MEKVQNFKHCRWVSDEISLNEVQQEHMKLLSGAFESHPSKLGWQESSKALFKKLMAVAVDDDVKVYDKANELEKFSNPLQMEEDCGIDLLTVPNELPSCDRLDDNTSIASKMTTHWFEGSFNDGVIPDGGTQKLLTLHHQSKELNKRMEVGDYSTLRYRSLKYFSTIRLPQPINTEPLAANYPNDIIINVRIQRPFFRKIHYKKQSNKFPQHSQELLLQGSQPLTALRDAIDCVNDFAVHENMANNPSLEAVDGCTSAREQFPSGMFYINGTCYTDLRHPRSKDYATNLLKWAQRQSDLGEINVKEMKDVHFNELKVRLGYPYLYLHQGDCEHLITFTDVRLMEATDPADKSAYPLLRGTSTQLSKLCCTCNRNLAVWVVVSCPLMPTPRAHLCDKCLKLFCYDKNDEPVGHFRLFRYYNEASVKLAKMGVSVGKFLTDRDKGASFSEPDDVNATTEEKEDQMASAAVGTPFKVSTVKLEKSKDHYVIELKKDLD